MSEQAELLPKQSVLSVVQRLMTERAIAIPISADDDLRAVGLTSLDMVNLVLSVEAELDLQIPESAITPANFRSVSTIDALVSSLRG